jgi:hypothetical protein
MSEFLPKIKIKKTGGLHMSEFLPRDKKKKVGPTLTCGPALQYFLYFLIKKRTSTYDKFDLSQITDDSSCNAMTIKKTSRCSNRIVYDDFHSMLVMNTLSLIIIKMCLALKNFINRSELMTKISFIMTKTS